MRIRSLELRDVPALEAFLAQRTETAMFLRSNLRAGGIVWQGARYQGAWVGAVDGERVAGVVCHGWNGMLLLQADPDALPGLVDAALAASGRAVSGFSGPWDQVVSARAHLGLSERSAAIDGPEDLFALDLADLVVPGPLAEGSLVVHRATEADAALLVSWRTDYERVLIPGGTAAQWAERAEAAIATLLGEGRLFVAVQGGVPVAMSAFNAALPDVVQIGGVYTPPGGRSRGYGRAVVGGSLLAARSEGVVRSILFTERDNTPAQRAYRALGYRAVGRYGVVLFA